MRKSKTIEPNNSKTVTIKMAERMTVIFSVASNLTNSFWSSRYFLNSSKSLSYTFYVFTIRKHKMSFTLLQRIWFHLQFRLRENPSLYDWAWCRVYAMLLLFYHEFQFLFSGANKIPTAAPTAAPPMNAAKKLNAFILFLFYLSWLHLQSYKFSWYNPHIYHFFFDYFFCHCCI